MTLFLSDLFRQFPFPLLSRLPSEPVPISGVVFDSRLVQPGNLFVAMQGESLDGHRFIPQAVERGAVAVVGTQPAPLGLTVPYIRLEDSRRALAHLAAAFYGYPARQMKVIGVTGTDGKTTTVNLIYNILVAASLKAGMVSTVNAVIGDQALDTGFHVTTPDAPDVQRYLSQMVSVGTTHVVLETTSHGLAQHRVEACEYDVAVVTNITHEHLNEHGSFENYQAAKGHLFELLAETGIKPSGNPRLAALNRDDDSYSYLADLVSRLPSVRQVSYGFHPQADVRAEQVELLPDRLRFSAQVLGREPFPVEAHLVGAYNVSNCLAAITAVAVGLDLPSEAIRKGISALSGVPGRCERIELGQGFTAIVDFAHTPNALARSLEAARQLTNGKVIAVFGSAGLRDRDKRWMMAETSIRMADRTILTAEDPRTESLDKILAEMAQGAQRAGGVEGKIFWRVPDRGEAIRFALSLAEPGDVVMACGKGHEQSMCFGTIEYPWDDRTAMKAALSELLGIRGPQMPELPTSTV